MLGTKVWDRFEHVVHAPNIYNRVADKLLTRDKEYSFMLIDFETVSSGLMNMIGCQRLSTGITFFLAPPFLLSRASLKQIA